MKEYKTGISWLDKPKVRTILAAIILVTNPLIGLIIMWTPFIYWSRKAKVIISVILIAYFFLRTVAIFAK